MSDSTGHTTERDFELADLSEGRGPGGIVHVVVATREEELLWAVFDGFCELSTVRVTGCSTLPQTRQICAADPPSYLIIDTGLLEHEPMDLMTLAHLADSNCHIVALTAYPVFEIGARFGSARLTFLQKPVSAHDLLLLLRLQIGEPSLQTNVC